MLSSLAGWFGYGIAAAAMRHVMWVLQDLADRALASWQCRSARWWQFSWAARQARAVWRLCTGGRPQGQLVRDLYRRNGHDVVEWPEGVWTSAPGWRVRHYHDPVDQNIVWRQVVDMDVPRCRRRAIRTPSRDLVIYYENPRLAIEDEGVQGAVEIHDLEFEGGAEQAVEIEDEGQAAEQAVEIEDEGQG